MTSIVNTSDRVNFLAKGKVSPQCSTTTRQSNGGSYVTTSSPRPEVEGQYVTTSAPRSSRPGSYVTSDATPADYVGSYVSSTQHINFKR